jgi:glycerophosphoryl diester phosphodiesterase
MKIPQQVMDVLEVWFNRGYGMLPRLKRRKAVEPIIVGHRGVCGHPAVKENTLEAFDLAVDLGGGIELDLHLTKDGVPVVSHDPDLLRIHGVEGVISQLTLGELRALAPQVPTLDEVFERYGTRCAHYFIESKVYEPAADAQLLISKMKKAMKAADLVDHVTLISLDARPLDQARKVYPELPKAFVFGLSPKTAVAYALSHEDTGLAGWYFSYPGKIRKFLADRNLHEGVGHIDYKNTMTACSNQGFRYQFTNRIDKVAGLTSSIPRG